MRRHPLVLALGLALLPGISQATDLIQAYDLARQSDPQFAAAEAGQRATTEGSVQARAALLPQLSGNASLTRNRSESTGNQVFGTVSFPADTTTTSTSRNYTLNAEQVLFDGSRFATLRSRNALTTAGGYSLASAGDDLMVRTATAYFNVLIGIETLSAAEAQQAALKKQFDTAQKRLDVGLAPITDVHEARAQYESAVAGTIQSRNALADSYQALAEITGTPVTGLMGLPEDFKPTLPEGKDANGWVQAALDNNPALKSQHYQVKSAEADVTAARADHLPTLYLSGSYGKNSRWGDSVDNIGNTTTNFANDSKGPTVGVTLSVPIFAGGATQSRVRQALAQRDVAQDQYEQQKRALERNTRSAYQNVVAGISTLEARRAALTSAKSAYDASQVGLEVGTRTVLDVLINQQNLFNAQQAYSQAKYNYLQSLLLLKQAAGTLAAGDLQDINRLLTVDADAKLQPGDMP
jgi:outer membrane protein